MNKTYALNIAMSKDLFCLIAWRLLWANSVAGGGGGDPSC